MLHASNNQERPNEFHPENPSTFHVATLLYPSQFCWFPADGEEPYPGYINRFSMMEELNREIGKLNNEWYYKNRDLYKNLTDDCVAPEPKYVKFHTYGLRMKGAMKHWWEW